MFAVSRERGIVPVAAVVRDHSKMRWVCVCLCVPYSRAAVYNHVTECFMSCKLAESSVISIILIPEEFLDNLL